MGAGHAALLDGLVRVLTKLLLAMWLVAAMAGLMYLVVLSPLLVTHLYDDDRDWSMLADIGETYGAASALLATFALAAVLLSLMVQYRQHRSARRNDHRQRTRETVLLALENPGYAQCWGPRFAPDHVDERLFFYASFVVLNWSYAWEDRLISELKLRELLRAFFGSEIPRMYWERNGEWQQPRRRWPRRQRFLAVVNEEYLRAIKKGPPARGREPLQEPSRPFNSDVEWRDGQNRDA